MPHDRRAAFAHFLGSALVILAVFAAAVWGVVTVLDRQGVRSANACVARLPDGSSYTLSGEQARNAALIAAVAMHRGMPARAATIGIATALQESSLLNLDHGDRDSLGLFQQRPSQGWGTPDQIMDPVYAANAFYDALGKLPGYESMSVNDAAQAVQRSGHPDAYAKHEQLARAFASAFTGHSPAELFCDVPTLEDTDVPGRLAALPELDAAVETTELIGPGNVPLHVLDAADLLDGAVTDASRAGWVAGHWLVATARETGARVVVVGDLMWVNGSMWREAGDLAQPAGRVLVG